MRQLFNSLIIGALCIGFAPSVFGWQVLSPSTAPNTHKRNMAAAAGIQQQAQNIEPSQRLLIALNTMVPFEVFGSEVEEGLRGVARTFLTGSTAETIAAIDAVRSVRSEVPPAPMLIANMLFAIGDRAKSQTWLEKTAFEFPDHPAAFLGFARFSIAAKRIADADAMLEKTTRLIDAGSWTEAQKKLFRIEYLDILVSVNISRQRLDEAKANLLELQGMMEKNGKIPVRLAQVEFDLGNIDACLFQLREAAQLNSGMRKPEIIVGEWFMRKQDSEESAKWITLAATEYPNDVSVQIDFSRWLLQTEKFNEASVAVAKAEQLGGDVYAVGYMKGQLAFAQQEYGKAGELFDQVLKNKPNDADATNMLALSLIENPNENQKARALELAVLNVRLYPKSPTATASLGWIYYRVGKNAEAEQAFRAVIASNNLAPTAAYYVASYLNDRSDFAGAKNLLEQAVTSPDYFMFRRPAESLLISVTTKLATQQEEAKNSDQGSINKLDDPGKQ